MAVPHLPRLIYGARGNAASTTTAAAIPLWALIVTVIGGTVIIVTALASTLIFLQRWRHRRRRQDGYRKRAIMIDGREVSVYRGGGDTSTETLERTGKLRKRVRVERDIREGEGSDSEEETGLGRPLSLPPVLPMIKRASSGLFSVSSSRKSLVRQSSDGEMMSVAVQRPGAGHRRRTSNAWVDEDAIHGPVMNVTPRKGNKRAGKDRMQRSWRRTIRDSWPLKSLSPTLPKIALFSPFGSPKPASEAQQQTPTRPALHDAPSTFRFQHHLATVPRLTIPAGQQDATPQLSPPRQLPKPPQQALLAANKKTAGSPRSMSPVNTMYMPRDRGLSYYIYEDTGDRPVPAPLRLSKGKMNPNPRFPSSESTLTHLLSNTDSRLAEGGTKRNRGSLGPSAIGRERSGTVSTGVGGESSVTLVGSSTASGSPDPPPKLNFRMHARMDSQDSAISDDSLLALPVAEPSPGLGLGYFHGLSSPNRGSPPRQQQQQQQMRQPTRIDSPESALSLSTCPEVDETAIDEPPIKEASKLARDASFKEPENDDPFVVLRTGPNVTAERRVPPASRAPGAPIHAFNDAPRLFGGPSQLLGRNEITLSFLRSDSPLSTISGNSRSPELRPRRSPSPQNVVKTQTPRGGQQIKVYLPAPTSAVSSTSHLHRRSLSTVPDEEEDEEASIPGISLTSPSDNDKYSPAAKRLADLRAKASSPTLGRNREQTPDMPPPRPALPRDSIARPPSSYYETHSDNDAASFASSTHRRAAGELRKPSNTSSSHYTDFEREKLESLSNMDLASQEQQRRSQTIRLVPSEPKLLPVSSTIAQLRRMNSAVSAYSHAASGYSEGSSASPVLPTLREEETGRFVTPPRKREASRNYLSVGGVPAGKEYEKGDGGSNSNNNNNKENERHDDVMETKIPQVDFGGGVKGLFADSKRFLRIDTSPERKSVESLGLYDADGFWISPERRANRRH
ncbi:hypothetical protein N0V82_001801 [Gnomoniopsis sp. IMI 355080]|nr:hypothetical protein N0V82_001801 [Gnomoniopsis sp. IMI 355080]